MANPTTTPETAVLESVIENAKETTEVTTKNLRELAQHGARKANQNYEQLSKAAQEAGDQLTSHLNETREGMAQTGLKLLDAAKEDADATFVAMREMFEAKSLVDAFDVSTRYWRGRLESRMAHMQDFSAHLRKATDEAVRPMRERLEKFAQA